MHPLLNLSLIAPLSKCLLAAAGSLSNPNRDMAKDRETSNQISLWMAANDERMVQAATDVARAMCNKDGSSNPKLRQLQIKKKELNIKQKELELERKGLDHERNRAQAAAFDKAKMMVEFLQAGLSLDAAKSATRDCLGAQTQQHPTETPEHQPNGQQENTDTQEANHENDVD
ncbi:hypothetical protein PCASD_07785 [Puccinia coronata f. sp. avenae]|uniref:No apical meristem-associated C-terminal domain-containing protein n=1 Tax=Puccinia coronata f. sp. avenae TaxID=200324 RepID=A0A2N5US46_9BASI|nr:hypothetical protein PCASD_07785 [Puccinia coronata f. sp. avenae]